MSMFVHTKNVHGHKFNIEKITFIELSVINEKITFIELSVIIEKITFIELSVIIDMILSGNQNLIVL